MARSYKIYKAYHTSHHNTTKTHLQISTPPSSVQQRIDIHNFPPNHMESQTSKPQASSNAPTLTTSLQTTRKLSLSSQPSSVALMAHPTPVRPLYPYHHDRTVRDLQQKSGCFGVSLGPYLASEVVHGEVPGGHKPQGKAHLSEPGTHQRTWRVMGRPLRETPQTLSMARRNDGTRTSAANLTRPSVSSCPHQTPVL